MHGVRRLHCKKFSLNCFRDALKQFKCWKFSRLYIKERKKRWNIIPIASINHSCSIQKKKKKNAAYWRKRKIFLQYYFTLSGYCIGNLFHWLTSCRIVRIAEREGEKSIIYSRTTMPYYLWCIYYFSLPKKYNKWIKYNVSERNWRIC